MKKGKVLTGKVIAASTPKTITVVVEDFYRHPLYKKTLKRRKKYLAHTERKVAVGEEVRIRESRPLSKRKHFVLEEVVESQNSKFKSQNAKLQVKS